MKASELINQLGDLWMAHGDLEVVNDRDEPIGEPEFNDELGNPVFVLG